MLTPRMLRPHSVELHNALPETPMESPGAIVTSLNHVSFAGTAKSRHTQMDTRNSDEFVCVVDCTDCDAVFQEPEVWDNSRVGWTAHADGDFLIHNGVTYTIKGYRIIRPFCNDAQLVEILCQR